MPPRQATKPTQDDRDNVASAAKKPARAKRTVRGRRAALQQIMSMPMDVIYEICLHLQPKDLLSLARASKDLRALFMSRSTLSVWKAARLNVPGMPPCPEDLSEPAYASLMFDTHCSTCGRKNCGRIYWQCRVRLCKGCYEESSVDINALQDRLHARGMGKFADVLGWSPLLQKRRGPIFPIESSLYKPRLRELVEQLRQLPSEGGHAALQALRESVAAIRESAEAMEKWYDDWKATASLDRTELRGARLDAIKAKLVELGWQTEIDYLFKRNDVLQGEFTRLPQVHKTQQLTPQGWNKIEKDMVKFMEKTQQARLTAARVAVVKSRCMKMKPMIEDIIKTIPGLTLFTIEVALRIPEVAHLLDPYVTEFDEDALQQNLSGWITAYLAKRDHDALESLAELVRKKCNLAPDCDPFSLAVGTVFVCTACHTGRPLHHAIRHHCASHLPEEQNEYENCVRSAFPYWALTEGIWDARNYEHGLENLMHIIRCCDLDVKTATVEDLDNANVLFRKSTVKRRWFVPISDWRTAVIAPGSYSTYRVVERATDEQSLAAQPLLAAAQIELERTRAADEVYRCVLCPTCEPSCLEAVKAHLRETHGILNPDKQQYLDDHLTVPVADPVYLVSANHREKAQTEGSFLVEHGLFEKGMATFFKM